MEEIITVNNPNVLRFIIHHDIKKLRLIVKTNTSKNVKADTEIMNIFDKYLLKKYKIIIFESGTEDPRILFDKILEDGIQKLIKANARV
ncbi:hypothetical protein [Clostridium sp. CF012]|uniref:hypothetical protein n=1 Tax=Clostridium sp. CF012 TaxID=2843319 RepID=UPI001C0C7145|nr:hypothetical protein [Clostridium sp. CF012]MBU3142248.1 hypothetical protein [Clostridium sp. CF012]